MSIVDGGPYEAMVGDPDDHRPSSGWRLLTDPGDVACRVDTLAIINESIAPGDRIPLHVHDLDEAISVLEGSGEARLGAERRRVTAGSTVFIPAGVPHGTTNDSEAPLGILAVFPATTIEVGMLERNPAPGTEADPPRRTRYDLRTGAFEVIG